MRSKEVKCLSKMDVLILWKDIKTSNIEYYDIQYAADRSKSPQKFYEYDFLNFMYFPIFINIPLAVGFGVMLMILFKVTHPPAGGNPIIVIIGSVSYDYLLTPVLIGSLIVVVFGIVINKFILKKEYPK